MTDFVNCHGLKVASVLQRFVDSDVLPGTGLDSQTFWAGFSALVHELAPVNRSLLLERDRLQTELDSWHREHPGPVTDMPAYRDFLSTIGYLQAPPENVKVSTRNVDTEISVQAGPQLVVPAVNARYALNAANARWGSLYDALYGTDAIGEDGGAEKGKGYNPVRGAKVIAFARDFLDQAAPLASGSHKDAAGYRVEAGQLVVALKSGGTTGLKNTAQFVGYQGDAAAPSSVLLLNNGLHIDIRIDKTTAIGQTDAAGVADVVVEAALSTILDLEDSVAAVDAEDKVLGYSNWLGIIQATLTEQVAKGGKTFTRGLNPDRVYTAPQGGEVRLHGRSLMFLRNVGHLMTNPAILWGAQGQEIPEGIMDAMITTTCAMVDLQKKKGADFRNSRNADPLYNGPLVVVTDKTSASASEILAAAIQDYGRGVVIGDDDLGLHGSVSSRRGVKVARAQWALTTVAPMCDPT